MFDELGQVGPDGVGYAAFVLDDGLTYVHLVEVDGDENPITALPSFKRYVEAVRERCEAPPVVGEARELGSYRSAALAGQE